MGFAMVCAKLHNVNCSKVSEMKNWTDFMPKEKKVQSTEEMIEVASMLTAAFGGKDKRKCQQ